MKYKVLKRVVAAIGACAGLLLLDALFFEKYFFQIRSYAIGDKAGQKKIRLLLLTDLHIKKRLWPYYKRLAKVINQLKPDLILIAGDTLDGKSSLKTVDAFFSLISHDIQKVAILGNHDHVDAINTNTLSELYRKHNCELMINESKPYILRGERFMITGLDDFIEGYSCVFEALQDVGREANHILLIHSPLQQESVLQHVRELNASRPPSNQLNIGYLFAGHNHGGQVRFLNLVPKLPIMSGRYVDGWYNRKSPYLYVSRGFGTSTIPFRFGARAEVSIFEYYVGAHH